MGQRGIHPLLHTMRVVMRNGASFNVETTMFRPNPYMLQVDTTTNPAYTGESTGLSTEDARLQRLLSKYEGFYDATVEAPVAESPAGSEAAAGSKQPPPAAAAAAAASGKKKK